MLVNATFHWKGQKPHRTRQLYAKITFCHKKPFSEYVYTECFVLLCSEYVYSKYLCCPLVNTCFVLPSSEHVYSKCLCCPLVNTCFVLPSSEHVYSKYLCCPLVSTCFVLPSSEHVYSKCLCCPLVNTCTLNVLCCRLLFDEDNVMVSFVDVGRARCRYIQVRSSRADRCEAHH